MLGLPPAFTLSQDQTLHLRLPGPKPHVLRQDVPALFIAAEITACRNLQCSFERRAVEPESSPARRPHKSPAHTVKDQKPRLSAEPNPPGKCPSEPATLQHFPPTSTPRRRDRVDEALNPCESMGCRHRAHHTAKRRWAQADDTSAAGSPLKAVQPASWCGARVLRDAAAVAGMRARQRAAGGSVQALDRTTRVDRWW